VTTDDGYQIPADVVIVGVGVQPNTALAEQATLPVDNGFLVDAARRTDSPDIYAAGDVANAVNPGGVATGLQRNFTTRQKESLDAAEAAGVFTYKTIEQGAATTIVAAVAPEFAHTGGHYLDDAQEAYTVPNDAEPAPPPHGVKEWALDPAVAIRLWAVSTGLLRRTRG